MAPSLRTGDLTEGLGCAAFPQLAASRVTACPAEPAVAGSTERRWEPRDIFKEKGDSVTLHRKQTPRVAGVQDVLKPMGRPLQRSRQASKRA